MRGGIFGGIVLLGVILLVILNGFYVRSTVETLREGLQALPEAFDPLSTPEEVADLERSFVSEGRWLGLSVSQEIIDEVAGLLCRLEVAAREGDGFAYEEARRQLWRLMNELERQEKWRFS